MSSYTHTRYCGWERAVTLLRVFLVVAGVVAGALMAAPDAARSAPVAPDQELALGSPAAKVTIVEYASLSCPHCARFHEETLPKLREKYIDSGKVRLVFRDFPLERTAFWAAIIARCAGPERYFAFIDVFFKKQSAWYSSEDPLAALTRLARLGGLGGEEIQACIADQGIGDSILRLRMQGEKDHDVSSTPSFVIDGKTYRGALSLEEIEKLILPLLD
jgi:protein-disulfide isomerase